MSPERSPRKVASVIPLGAIQLIPVEKLLLDDENPRVGELIDEHASQSELTEVLWQDTAADELALSIAHNGFLPVEPLLVEPRGQKFVVIEGNRRLTAVRVLLDPSLQQKLRVGDLPTMSKRIRDSLQTLPAIVTKRREIWEYIGFKHLNGPQAWRSFAKAEYIASLHDNEGISLDDIAARIGDRHSTVQRLYLGIAVLRQAERWGVYDKSMRTAKKFAFSHLYTGLDYAGVKKHLGVGDEYAEGPNPIPSSKKKALGEFLKWLYGDRGDDTPPVVQRQNPDLRRLDSVLQSSEGVVALRRRLPLASAYEASRGDEQLFAEALQSARQTLIQARGYTVTGFKGSKSQLEIVADIVSLAQSLEEDVQMRIPSRRARK